MKLWWYLDHNPGSSMILQNNNKKTLNIFSKWSLKKVWNIFVIISRALRYYWDDLIKWQTLSVLANLSSLCDHTMWNSPEIFGLISRVLLFALSSVIAALWFLPPAGQCMFHSLTISITLFHSSIPHQCAPASSPHSGPSPRCFWEILVKDTAMHMVLLLSVPPTCLLFLAVEMLFCISAGCFEIIQAVEQ